MSSDAEASGSRITTANRVERFAPWIAALAAFSLKFWVLPDLKPAKLSDLLSTSANVAGVAVGFLATGQALLCSLANNSVIETLRKYGLFERMLSFFSSAILWCLCLLVFTTLSYWTDLDKVPWLFSIWCGNWAGALVSALRVIDLFKRILHPH